MPQIPEQGLPQYSLDVPGSSESSAGFGRVGAALAGLGQDVGNSGFDIFQRVQHAEAADSSANAYAADKLNSEKKIQDLKLSSPDGYIHEDPKDPNSKIVLNPDGSQRTISHEFHDWSNEQYKSSQENLPTTLAQRMYRERALPFFSDQIGIVQNESQVLKVKAFDQNQDLRVKAAGNELVSSPSLDNFYLHAMDITRDMNNQIGVMHNATDAQAKVQQSYKQLSRDLVQGAYTAEILSKKEGDPTRVESIMKWRAILDGQDPVSKVRQQQGLPTLSTMMDPIQKSIEEEKLIRLLPGAKKADLSDWDKLYENAVTAAQSGRMREPDLQSFRSQIHEQVKNGERQPVDGGNRAAKLLAAYAHGQVAGPEFKMSTPDQMAALVNNSLTLTVKGAHDFAKSFGLSPNYMGEVSREKLDSEMNQLIRNDLEARDKDFAAYVATPAPNGAVASIAASQMLNMDFSRPIALARGDNPKTLQQAFKDIHNFAISSEMAPDKVTLVPKNKADTLAYALQNPKESEEMVGNHIKGMMSAFGRYYPEVVDQMVKDKTLPSGWALMENMNPHVSQVTMTQMISALRTPEGAANVPFDNALASTGDKREDFTTAVGKLVAPWSEAQASSHPFSLAGTNFQAEVSRVVGNLAKQYYVQAPGEGVQVAAQRAYDQMVAQFSHVMATGQSGKLWGMKVSGVVSIPKNLATDNEAVTIVHNMAQHMTEDGIKALHPDVPPKPNGAPSDFADKFPGFVSSSTPRTTFMYQHGVPGVGIIYRSGNDFTPLMKGGRPYFIPLSEAKRPHIEESFVDKLKKFNPFGDQPKFQGPKY